MTEFLDYPSKLLFSPGLIPFQPGPPTMQSPYHGYKACRGSLSASRSTPCVPKVPAQDGQAISQQIITFRLWVFG